MGVTDRLSLNFRNEICRIHWAVFRALCERLQGILLELKMEALFFNNGSAIQSRSVN
jgi:hypothetical protein